MRLPVPPASKMAAVELGMDDLGQRRFDVGALVLAFLKIRRNRQHGFKQRRRHGAGLMGMQSEYFNQFAQFFRFLLKKTKIFLICRKFNFLKSPFVCEISSRISNSLISHFSIYYVTNTFFLVKHRELILIKKIFATKKDNNSVFLTKFNSAHLFS